MITSSPSLANTGPILDKDGTPVLETEHFKNISISNTILYPSSSAHSVTCVKSIFDFTLMISGYFSSLEEFLAVIK